jgi:hypothetical protein
MGPSTRLQVIFLTLAGDMGLFTSSGTMGFFTSFVALSGVSNAESSGAEAEEVFPLGRSGVGMFSSSV